MACCNTIAYLSEGKSSESAWDITPEDVIDFLETLPKVFIDEQVADHPESTDQIALIEVCKDYPAEEIIKKREDLNCDLIVMGTHGKGIVSKTLFGSVAKRVHLLSLFLKDAPEPSSDLDICPGIVQSGHSRKEDIETECIDHFQAVRVDGYFAGSFHTFVQNIYQFTG